MNILRFIKHLIGMEDDDQWYTIIDTTGSPVDIVRGEKDASARIVNLYCEADAAGKENARFWARPTGPFIHKP